MVGESFAIIAVILVMAAMMAKAGKRVFALFTLPLASLPLLHLIGVMLRVRQWIFAVDVSGAALGMLLCLLFSRSIRSKRGRWGYLFFCWFFQIALLVAYVINQ